MSQTQLDYDALYKLFDTVYGLGPASIDKLIKSHAKTIADLNDEKYYKTLKTPTKTYLKYYDELQERIPRNEIVLHGEKINGLINAAGDFYKIDIVGSFRRGEQYSGDIDVLFTLSSARNYHPTIEYVSWVTNILTTNGYLIKTLKNGPNVMNGIARMTPQSIARRLDVFFSPPDLYAFALLAKTGDINFNKSLRACVKEKNPDYSFSELGIRLKPDKLPVGDTNRFQTVDSILNFIGIGKRQPHEMVGHIPPGSCGRKEQSSSQSSSSLSRKNRRSRKRRIVPSRNGQSTQSNKARGETKQIERSVKGTGISPPKPPNLAYDSDATRLTPSPLTSNSSHDSDATYE